MNSEILKRLEREGVLNRDEGKNSIANVKEMAIEFNEEQNTRINSIRDLLLDKVTILTNTINLEVPNFANLVPIVPSEDDSITKSVVSTTEAPLEDVNEDIAEHIEDEKDRLFARLNRIRSSMERRKKGPRRITQSSTKTPTRVATAAPRTAVRTGNVPRVAPETPRGAPRARTKNIPKAKTEVPRTVRTGSIPRAPVTSARVAPTTTPRRIPDGSRYIAPETARSPSARVTPVETRAPLKTAPVAPETAIPDIEKTTTDTKKLDLGSVLKGAGSVKILGPVGFSLGLALDLLGPLAGRNEKLDTALENVIIPGTDINLLEIMNDERAQEMSTPFLSELALDFTATPTDLIDLATMISTFGVNKIFGTDFKGTNISESLIRGPYYENQKSIGAYRGTPEAKKIVTEIMDSLQDMTFREIYELDDLTVRRVQTLGNAEQRTEFNRIRKEAENTFFEYVSGYYIDETIDARAERIRGAEAEEPGFFQKLFSGNNGEFKQSGSVVRRNNRKKTTNIITDPTGSLN